MYHFPYCQLRFSFQVMELTPNVKYLHIGCDEVFQMGECSKCSQVPRDNLFLGHVSRVAKWVKRHYPAVTPIIWDDMLRHVLVSSIEEYHLHELVEPMVSENFLYYNELSLAD